MSSINCGTDPLDYIESIAYVENTTVISKYAVLMTIIREMGHDLKGAYTGSKISLDKLKRGISNARHLVDDCLREAENSDSVEWCPVEPYCMLFVCGTYKLLENENVLPEEAQKRVGTILLMEVSNNQLEKINQVESYGILDCKWFHQRVNGDIVLAAVNAIGEIIIYCLEDKKLLVKDVFNLKSSEEGDYMTLSVNWSRNESSDSVTKLCVTDSKGNGAVLSYSLGKMHLIEKWNAHSLEAWTINFDSSIKNLLYSGGDDAKLRLWDLNSGKVIQKATISKQDTGVTIIDTNTGIDHLILSGSFDEKILFWDSRMFKSPLNEVKSSGGLWRVKCFKNFALTANIYGGFQIVDIMSQTPKVVADYKEHVSLAYGADWCHASAEKISKAFHVSKSSVLIGTCSFYDHKLKISVWDPEFE